MRGSQTKAGLEGSLLNCQILGRWTGPRGEKMAGGFTGTDSQDLATILDLFRAIFDDLGPDRLSETSLSQQQTSALSQQQTSALSQQQTSVRSQQQTSVCSSSTADICAASTEDIYPVSTEDIYPVSTEDETAAGRRPAAVMSSVETG